MFEERATSDEFCKMNKAERGSEEKRGATGARAGNQICLLFIFIFLF